MDFFHGTIRIESSADSRVLSGDLYRHPIGSPRPESSFGQEDAIPIFPRDQYSCYLELAPIVENTHDAESFDVRLRLFRYELQDGSLIGCGERILRLTRSTAPSVFRDTPFGERFYTGSMEFVGGKVVGKIEMGRVSQRYFRRASLEIDCLSECSPPLDNGNGVGWHEVFENMGWKLDPFTVEKVGDSELGKHFPSIGRVWSTADLHEAMQTFRRPAADLDHDWHYHILCVPRIAGFGRGVMYDGGSGNIDSPPREGAALASEYCFPGGKGDEENKSKEAKLWRYTDFAGAQFSAATALYFRTAVHELGHLLGLGHNQRDDGFMNASNIIALNMTLRRAAELYRQWGNATREVQGLRDGNDWFRLVNDQDVERAKKMKGADAKRLKETHFEQKYVVSKEIRSTLALLTNEAEEKYNELVDRIQPFPKNILWDFNDRDLRRLRHGPDPAVRPGGRCQTKGVLQADDTLPEQAPGLELEMKPLDAAVPVGAPVRVCYRIRNTSNQTSRPKWLQAPDDLSLKSGNITFEIRSSDGKRREVSALLAGDDEEEIPTPLGPGAYRSHAATLFTDGRQCVFPRPGDYEVRARLEWTTLDENKEITAEPAKFYLACATRVRVLGPRNNAHLQQAKALISRLDLQRGIVMRTGAGRSRSSLEVFLESVSEDSPLWPHYQCTLALAAIERARLSSREENAELMARALSLISESMVMTHVELARFLDIVSVDAEKGANQDELKRAKRVLLAHARRIRASIPRTSSDRRLTELFDQFGLLEVIESD